VLACLGRDDPLPSWNDGAAESAIVDFVEAGTTEGGEPPPLAEGATDTSPSSRTAPTEALHAQAVCGPPEALIGDDIGPRSNCPPGWHHP
jgi:hypothetical protein